MELLKIKLLRKLIAEGAVRIGNYLYVRGVSRFRELYF